MTRINLVPPVDLMDQHLIREYGELPRIFGNVMKAVEAKKRLHNFKIPPDYVLGTGHMTFFYNKLLFLEKRFASIVAEMHNRGFRTTYTTLKPEFRETIPAEWWGDYTPTEKGIELSKTRIAQKIAMKPWLYKYYGK